MVRLTEIAERDRATRIAAGQSSQNSAMRVSSLAQFKSISIRMIKALKEDLAKIQSEYIARVNSNIDDYLAAKDTVKMMDID